MDSSLADRNTVAPDRLSVLHVDDDPDFADLTSAFLERQDVPIEVVTETSAADGLRRLEDTVIDCVVSDYDMPGSNGLEFLESVRAEYPNLPFILFTGKGSEEVASDAISAGVTDYLQKGSASEAYELLANRIQNAVSREHARTNYREIMEKVPEGILVQDPADGEFVDMNSGYCDLFGYEREAFFEAGFEAIHPDEGEYTVERARELVQKAVEDGPQRFQWPGVRKDGERIWCEVNLRPARLDGRLRMLAAVRDVSERRAQKRELQYERDRLGALFQSVPEPVVHIRLEDGAPVVVRVNEAFSEVFGYTPAEAAGESLDELIVPDQYREEARDINRRTRGDDLIERELVRQTPVGERTFLFKAAPIRQDEDGVEWVGTYVDLTDRKQRD